MKTLEKIKIVTKNILNLYEELIDIEIDKTSSKEVYKQKIEDIKLYIELEEQYYRELEKIYPLEEIIKIKRKLNTDNIVDSQIGDLHFSTYYKSAEELIKRRIFNKLDDIAINNYDNDALYEIIENIVGNFDYQRQSFMLEEDEIFVLNHAKTFLKLQYKVIVNLYLKYLYYIQLYINKRICLTDLICSKYNLIFVNKEIEKRLIQNEFKINLKSINEIFYSNADQKIYNYFLKNNSLNFFSLSISELMNLKDSEIKKASSNFIIHFYESVIRSSALQLDEEMIEIYINMIGTMKEEDAEIIKTKLINIMNITKKDKTLL